MKTLRSPIAIAAAALMAAPPVVFAQPVSLTPPREEPAPADTPTEALPAGAPIAIAPIPAAAEGEPAELRGPVGPLPTDLSLASLPPSPPTSPPPPPAAAAAPTVAPVAAPSPPAPPPPPRMASIPSATVSVGAQDGYTRLSFRFQGATTVTPIAQGNRLDLRFSRAADIDIAELRSTPPRLVREVRRVSAEGAPVRLSLTLEPGVRHRSFVDGERVVVDLMPPEGGVQPAGADGDAPVPATAPVRGNASVRVVEDANVTRVTVTWPAPARAAAFRRGEAIWLLFDAQGRVDLTGVARVGRRHQNIETVQGEGVVGLRIPAAADVQVSASANENSWTFTLGSRAQASAAAELERVTLPDGRGRLTARFGREGVVRWIRDPEIGDRIAVALMGGPARGVNARRATLEAALLPAAHGGVVEPRADDVTATFADGVLTVGRGDAGLIAAQAATVAQSELQAGLNEGLASDVAAIDAPTQAADLVHVRETIAELMRLAADEGVQEGAPVERRMALVRYLLQHELAAEALGALRIVAINQGELVEIDPEFRLMRAAANVMLGRSREAQADLSASALVNNPSAALWRGYAAASEQNWADARRELERGAGALEEHPAAWRARFQLALAQAAAELNDPAAAEAAARAAMAEAPDRSMRMHARLIEARVVAMRGDATRALAMFDELSHINDEEVAVRASVEAIRLRRESGVMRAIDAIEPLEALRFRWRGDTTELDIVGMLGDVYSELGRWRDALGVMRTAVDRYPADPASRILRADMATLFERLFLDGEADQLEPIQALGLFYEFSDLTPVGPNGDRIVRLLSGRLVHVDLLEQAAQLLQHQVDTRLTGLGKAQVAADLAAIYLMDRKPDQALVAIANSRQPNMPATLLADRRILEARALLDLGRLDAAAELVERDRSEDAQRVRAEAAWRARDWQRASVELRALLALRTRGAELDAHGRQVVLRTGVALTLAGNEDGVRALYREYAGDLAGTPEADAFEIVASGIHADGAAIRDVARAVARTDLMERFLTRLRTEMTAQAAAAPTPAPAAPQTPPPQAAPVPATPPRPTA